MTDSPLEHLTEERIAAARTALYQQDVTPTDRMIDLADSVLTQVDEIDLSEPYPEDRAHEIADGTVPVYNADILETVSSDPSLWSREPEVGPAFDGSPTPVNIGAGVLYDILSAIAHSRLQERQDEADEDA
jgi:hypothetical protein